MSVDSKVFVELSKSKHMEAAKTVTENLNKWIREEFDLFLSELKGNHSRISYSFACKEKGERPQFTNGVSVDVSNGFDMFSIGFSVGGEHRSLKMFHDCSCDHRDYTDGDTLSFMIGHSGKHEKIMGIVIESLKPFGKVWYNHNDGVDEEYIAQN